MAIIKKAEPNAVCEPSLSIARGHIPGHIIACAKLKRIMNTMEVVPELTKAPIANTNPRIAETARACD